MNQSRTTLYTLTNLIAVGAVLLGSVGIIFVMATSPIHSDPASGHVVPFSFTAFHHGPPIFQYLTPLGMKLTGLSGILFAIGMIALLLNALANGKSKKPTSFGYTYIPAPKGHMQSFKAVCPICNQKKVYSAPDDFWHARDGLRAESCPYGVCWTRERALAHVIKSLYPENILRKLKIHESSPAPRGISSWLKAHCKNDLPSGYYPAEKPGTIIDGLRNENLESQSFAGGIFDLVVHLDVMEHLFEPFAALREIYRTLKPGGRTIFSVPTGWVTFYSEQVAFQTEDGVQITGEPEYHGNPQDEHGALVTWRYGYDLPLLISRKTDFDTEVRRFQSRQAAATGAMTEIYVLTKPG